MSDSSHETSYATTPYDIATMPPGVPYIVGNEAAERFSFYGMKAILAVFMTKYLVDRLGQPAGMSDEQARAAIAYFVAAVYVTPFIGAVLADWLLGKYRTIICLSLVYCVGHGILALMDTSLSRTVEPKQILFWGLATIALGSGGIKPCVSAHVGDQFGRRNQHLLERVFSWFYFSINLGAFLSTIATPLLLERLGASVAFGVPGVLMVLATLVFWMGRNHFVHIPPAGERFFAQTFSREGGLTLLNLAPLILFIAMFWSLFDQTASAWVLQADKMDRNIFGIELLTSQIQAANPLLILILIPIFSYAIYPAMGRLFTVTPLRKIGIGLFVTVLSFLISAWIEQRIQAGERPHVMWQVLAYVVITSAEVMVSITGLEFSYTQAPKAMKSIIMALFLLSVTLGNLFTGVVNDGLDAWRSRRNAEAPMVVDSPAGAEPAAIASDAIEPGWITERVINGFEWLQTFGFDVLNPVSYYWFFSACMLATAVVYVLWSQLYRGSTYIQGEDVPADDETAEPDVTTP